MRADRCQPKRQHPGILRVVVTVAALLLLAGSMLLALLLDDTDGVLIITLVTVVLGWVATLTLASSYSESPTPIINPDDDSSRSSPIPYRQLGRTGP